MLFGLSKWFFIGVTALIIGIIIALVYKNQTKSKSLENGYLLIILGLVGIISEFTDLANTLFFIVLLCIVVWVLVKIGKISKTVSFAYYARDFLPILVIVWVVRAFLGEIYLIPSSSMRPDLIPSDFVVVSKFSYGIRLPITNNVILPIAKVANGDVVVFKDPTANRDLIKRVIGIPGDVVDYHDKKLTVNNIAATYTEESSYSYSDTMENGQNIEINNGEFIESINGKHHNILLWNTMPTLFSEQVQEFPYKDSNCKYDSDGFTCTVPAGHYFMMGDNRDNSLDSRYWGFASNDDILGKAKIVLFNSANFKRAFKVIN